MVRVAPVGMGDGMDVPVAISLLVLLLGDSRLRHASGHCLRAGASVPIAAAVWGQRRLGSASGRQRSATGAQSARLAPHENAARTGEGAIGALLPAPSAAHRGETGTRSGLSDPPGTVRLIIRCPRPGADATGPSRVPLRRHRLFHDGGPSIRNGSVRIVPSGPRTAPPTRVSASAAGGA